MAEKKRYFLTGSDRAEYEHVHGPLQSDSADPRFVLVDDEEAERIRKFPPGVPPLRSQDWEQVKRVRAAEAQVGGFDAPDEAESDEDVADLVEEDAEDQEDKNDPDEDSEEE